MPSVDEFSTLTQKTKDELLKTFRDRGILPGDAYYPRHAARSTMWGDATDKGWQGVEIKSSMFELKDGQFRLRGRNAHGDGKKPKAPRKDPGVVDPSPGPGQTSQGIPSTTFVPMKPVTPEKFVGPSQAGPGDSVDRDLRANIESWMQRRGGKEPMDIDPAVASDNQARFATMLASAAKNLSSKGKSKAVQIAAAAVNSVAAMYAKADPDSASNFQVERESDIKRVAEDAITAVALGASKRKNKLNTFAYATACVLDRLNIEASPAVISEVLATGSVLNGITTCYKVDSSEVKKLVQATDDVIAEREGTAVETKTLKVLMN